MRFRVLGLLRVWNGHAWSTIRAAQQRAVMAVLLAESGQVVTSEQLIDEVWQDKPPPSALGTIQGYVMRLRRLIGDDSRTLLVTHGGGYSLETEPGDLDAAVFERLVESGRRMLSGGETAAAVKKISDGLALYEGRPFLDVPGCPAVSTMAQRLEGMRLGAIEEYLGAKLDLGHHDDVVDQLDGLVRDYPLRERLWGHLMLAMCRCGRRAEALDAYQRARTILAKELGVEPDPALRELHTAILAEDPRLTASPRASVHR